MSCRQKARWVMEGAEFVGLLIIIIAMALIGVWLLFIGTAATVTGHFVGGPVLLALGFWMLHNAARLPLTFN